MKTDILEVGKKVIPLKGLHGVKWGKKALHCMVCMDGVSCV